jgi:hypothetical protein
VFQRGKRGEYAGEKEVGDKIAVKKRQLFYKPLKKNGTIFAGVSGSSPHAARKVPQTG